MNTQKKYKFVIYLILLGLVIFGGCSANTYRAKTVVFNEPDSPKKNETSIFVFRENSTFGSARKFAIICNDTVMGVLTSGTFCQFNVKSAENEIVAYMTGPIMHYRVQDRPGENVYLFCKMGYTTGMFIEEIDKVTAENFMDKFKFMEISVKNKKTKINYKEYYDKLYQ